MRRLMGILCVLLASGAQADTLSDMRSAIGKLTAKEPVKATFATEAVVKADGRFSNQNTARRAWAHVTQDQSGLTIAIPKAILDEAERFAKNGEEDRAEKMIGSIRSLAILEAIDFRDDLLDLTSTAKVVGEKRTTFDGKPVRELTVTIHPKPKKDSSSIRIGSEKRDFKLKLWIGDDHLPLGAESDEKTTAGIMFIKGTFAEHRVFRFGYTADRIYVARVELKTSGSGLGQNVAMDGVQTLTMR